MQGLGEGIKGINFKKDMLSDKLPSWMAIEVGGSGGGSEKTKELLEKLNLKIDFKDALTSVEKNLIRSAVGILLIIITYGIFSSVLSSQIQSKRKEIQDSTSYFQSQVALINSDKSELDVKSAKYSELLANLEEQNKVDSNNKRLKYAIPTLLNKIMYSIPVNVQLTLIENTSDDKIRIVAQSDRQEQIGLFTAKLRNDVILKNVVTDSSVQLNGVVVVTIEGELP